MKILLGLIAAPIVLIILGVVGTELNKAWWDHKVRVLCEKEGGVTVYEVVTLTRDEYELYRDSRGGISIPLENSSVARSSGYQIRWTATVEKSGNPRVTKDEFVVYESSTGNELGQYVVFSRVGGDFPTGIMAPSNFGCEDITGSRTDFIGRIFIVEGEQ